MRVEGGADAETVGTPPSHPAWVFPSLWGQEMVWF